MNNRDRLISKEFCNFCEVMAGKSDVPEDIKFWEDLKIPDNVLPFTYEYWVMEACLEFSKSQLVPLNPKLGVNYDLNRRLNCYFFEAEDQKQNKEFMC